MIITWQCVVVIETASSARKHDGTERKRAPMKNWTAALLLLLCAVATSEAQLSCPGDNNGDGETTVDEIVAAIVAALDGCAAAQPTPTCPPPPAGRTCTPYETYECVTDDFGCSLCDCCNFEGVGGCCQLSAGCFDLIYGGDAAECVVHRHGYIVSGCPIAASCDASTRSCTQHPPSESQPTCPGDNNGDGVTTVDEIVAAVDAALNGCPVATPTSTPKPTATVTPTFPLCSLATRLPDVLCPDEGLACTMCTFNPCRRDGRDGRCDCSFSSTCTCDTEGPTVTSTPLCRVETPTPGPLPTNTEFFPTCCSSIAGCRDPRLSGGILCHFDESSFGSPFTRNAASGRCESS